MFIPFGEWTPDQPSNASGIVRAENALPIASGYESGPAPNPGKSVFPEIPERPLKVLTFYDSEGVGYTFAFCAEKIYELGGDGWRNITHEDGDYNTPPDRTWEVDVWGNFWYATNDIDPIQKYNFALGSEICEDIDGTESGITARFIAHIADYMVLADVVEEEEGDYRIWWSGRLRPELYTPSLITQAGFLDCVDIGPFRKLVGNINNYGLLLGLNGVARIDKMGPPQSMAVNTISRRNGCVDGATVRVVGGRTFWLSPTGWCMYDGVQIVEIGVEKVDRYTIRRVDPEFYHKITSIELDDRPVIMWAYVSQDSQDKEPDEVLYYNYLIKHWSLGKISNVILLGEAAPPIINVDPPITTDITVGWKDLSIDISFGGFVEISRDDNEITGITEVFSDDYTASSDTIVTTAINLEAGKSYIFLVADYMLDDDFDRTINIVGTFGTTLATITNAQDYFEDSSLGSVNLAIFYVNPHIDYNDTIEFQSTVAHAREFILRVFELPMNTTKDFVQSEFVDGDTTEVDIEDVEIISPNNIIFAPVFDFGGSLAIVKGDESDEFDGFSTYVLETVSLGVIVRYGAPPPEGVNENTDDPPYGEQTIDVIENSSYRVAITGDNTIQIMETGTAVATFQTTAIQPFKGKRCRVTRASLKGDMSTTGYRARVLLRDTQTTMFSSGPWTNVSKITGSVPLHKKGREVIIEVEASNFKGLVGLDMDVVEEGR